MELKLFLFSQLFLMRGGQRLVVAMLAFNTSSAKAHYHAKQNPVANQLECEVAVNNMQQDLVENLGKCFAAPREEQEHACQWNTARDMHIVLNAARQVAQGEQKLSASDRI